MTRMLGLRGLAIALFAMTPSWVVQAAPPPSMQADTHGCRLLVPADLGSSPVTWVGNCKAGLAEGLGVIRIGGPGTPRLFAGEMREGRPVAGFLDTGSADSAGPSLHFRGADGLSTRNRGEALRACAIAARGATSAATRYRAMHNLASAKFYDGWAATLRNCGVGSE